ncbi:ABC transporter permease [Paenibacillus marinisediminis]
MRRFNAIFRKELQAYFVSPTTYVALSIYVFVTSLLFYINFVMYQPSIVDFRIVSMNATFMFLLVVPLLTMRLISDEFRLGTDELLLTSPARIYEIVLGKYAASVVLMAVLVGTSLLYPIVMSFFGDMDIRIIMTSVLGMFLLTCAMSAVGLFASTLSQHQMVGGIAAFVMLMVFWLMDYAAGLGNGKMNDLLVHFALDRRLESFMKGVINGADMLFFIMMSALFVFLSVQILERKRWR